MQRKKMHEKVETGFNHLFVSLQEAKEEILKKVDQEMSEREEVIVRQESKLSKMITRITDASDSVKVACQNDSDIEFLRKKVMLRKCVDEANAEANQVSLAPATDSNIDVDFLRSNTLKSTVRSYSFLFVPADPKKCLANVQSLESSEVGTPCSCSVSVCDFNGDASMGMANISCSLSLVRNKTHAEPPEINHTGPGHYEICFSPKERGRHRFSIKVNDIHIPQSPFIFNVVKSPNKMSEVVDVITGLHYPTGMTTNMDSVLVVEHSTSKILALKNLRREKSCDLHLIEPSPAEITTDSNGNIYVTCVENHRVIKLNKEGGLVRVIGSLGSTYSCFNFPNGICANKLDEIYVCDSENHRIQVFNAKLDFLRSFGSNGVEIGSLNWPCDVGFDASNNAYIVERNNHRIQVFNREGRSLRIIGKSSLVRPICICVVHNLLYVTDCRKHSVLVFTISGQFVTCIGGSFLDSPDGVTVDSDGYVYVSTSKSAVFIF